MQPAATVDEVLITAELDRRPSRAPDFEAENSALGSLATVMAESPERMLQTLADIALRLCRAGSSGISLWDPNDPEDVFRWRATAGHYAPLVGGTLPRHFSPCGTVLDRGCLLLMSDPARFFQYIADLNPPAREVLLVPFHQDSVAVGTLWAVAHTPDSHFEAEDARLLTSLARFAGAAVHTLARVEAAEAAEHSLRMGAAQFQALVTATSEVVYRVSPDWSEMRLLVGREFIADTPEPNRGWIERYIFEEDRPRVLLAINEAIRTKSLFELEYRMFRIDGAVGWAFSRAVPILNAAGEVTEWFGTATDVTRRKEAEEKLRANQKRLAAALRIAHMCAWEWDPDADRVVASETATEVYGLRPGEILDSSASGFGLIHPDDADRHAALVRRAVERGESWHTEFRIVRPVDGRVAWLEERATAELDKSTGTVRLTGLVWDITDRKQAEAEQDRLSGALGLALAAADLGTWEWDPRTDAVTLTDRAAAIYGLEPGHTYSREWMRNLLDPGFRDEARTAAEQAVVNRADYDAEYRLLNGRWVAARGRGLYDSAGNLVRVLGVVQDITDRKKDEAVLRASERRHRILADLAAATQPLSDPVEVMNTAACLLAEHLATDRCAYAEVEGETVYVVTGDYTRGVPSMVGRWEVEAFGADHLRMMRAGEPYVVHDAETDSRIGPAALSAYRSAAIRAAICVPLHKDGRLTAAMAVHQSSPRQWTDDEVALVTTVVGRCWEALERARVNRALRASEARFRSLFESINEGYCVIEPIFDGTGRAIDYRYLLANRALEYHTGLTDIVEKTAREVMPGHESVWIEAYGRVATTGEPLKRTDYVADLGRWYEVSAFRLGGSESRQVGVLFANVTARVRAEDAIRANEQRLAEVFRHAPSFMAVLRGPDHVFELANDQYSDLVGGRELMGRTVREALPEVVDQGFITLLDEVYRTGKPYVGVGTRVILDPGGGRPPKERFLDFVYQPLRDATGAVTGLIVQGVDQTGRKVAEDALREADRRKDDFIALLAHELRNPLAPLRNGLQVLRLSDDSEVHNRARAMMERQLSHMVRLIEDLLDISRINRNKMELRITKVALADVVNHAVETARPAIDEAGHELSVTLPARQVYLDADVTRLSQVLSNLLTNSAKYTPRGGRVQLAAERSGSTVVISVQDTGIGIPQEALPTIFGMFSQVDRSVERATGGLGIGLALVKGLVEMHGGTVTAASPGPGQGSTFAVTLPIAAVAPDALASDFETHGIALPAKRILIVDDNRDGAASMAETLRLTGHEVRTAHDGLEAIAEAERFRPGLILMDVGMPRLNGLDATRRIRATPWGRDILIIALTGWGQEADKELSKVAGCDGHLVKPVHLPDLETLIRDLSGSKEPGADEREPREENSSIP